MMAISAESMAATESYFWILTVSLCVSIIITSIIMGLKNYRNLVFKDEQYPEKASEVANVGASIMFPASYMVSTIMFYYITCNLNCELKWNIWSLIVNIAYFGSVFIFFIKKICTKYD
jgi:hypothetical protein